MKTLVQVVAVLSLLVGIAMAQTTGAHISPNGITVDGVNQGLCGETSWNAGVDGCLYRVGPGQYGFGNGILPVASLIPIVPNFYLNPPAAAGSLGTATTGGTIAAGTYRVALTYVTATGGETPISSDSGSTQATTGSTSTLTGNAPASVSDAVGYRIYVSAAGGAANSEVLQPLSTAVCAGAFTAATGITVCPFGANYTFTSLASTGYATPAISGGPNTAGVVNLTAAAQAAVTTVTTAQTMLSIPLGTGVQNTAGRHMRIKGYGVFTDTTNTPQISIQLTEGGVTPVAVQSAALSGTAVTNAPFNFTCDIETVATGSSGTLEAHCDLGIDIAGTTTNPAITHYQDTNTAVSSTLNLTAANTLAVQVLSSASLNSMTLRNLTAEFIQN